MPEPLWGWFVVSIALIAVLEWEEIAGGYAPRSRLGHLAFAGVPVLYGALAAYIFIASPLIYAGQIQRAADTACARYGGLRAGAVTLWPMGRHWRDGSVSGGPDHDRIDVTCNDGLALHAEYVGGSVVFP